MSLPSPVLRVEAHLAASRESKAHVGLPWVRPWDNRGKCYMDGKWIQMLVKRIAACIPIYLQPFTSYSDILVGNCNFFYPLAFIAPIGGVSIGIPGKCLVLIKLESWGYQAVKIV